MNAREMYNHAKASGCIYADRIIKEKISDLGSIKRWSIYDDGGESKCKFYNRVEHTFMDENFNMLRNNQGNWEVSYPFYYGYQPQSTIIMPSLFQENAGSDLFTESELTRIEDVAERYYMRSVLRYGSGDAIYDSIGVLKASDNDDSPTIGFEIETQLADGFSKPTEALAEELLDIRLGHLENDGSIMGIEFDSHIFTWEKLKKCKGLFQQQFQKFSEIGLIPTSGAGLHIHIGRNAFRGRDSFEKFFYLINTQALRSIWETLARRTESREYSRYTDSSSLIELRRLIMRCNDEHGVAVNQQHEATYEVRIFQTTFSTDVLYGTIELLLNLVNYCNISDQTSFEIRNVLGGDYANKLTSILPGFRMACELANAVDMQMFMRLTRNVVIERMQECLTRGDIEGAGEWARRLERQNERDGAR